LSDRARIVSAFGFAATLLFVASTSRVTLASLDPASAGYDARSAMDGGADSFCRHPAPLSPRALRVCPHAKSIPGCDAFVAACDAAGASGGASSSSAPPVKKDPERLDVPSAVGLIARALLWAIVLAAVLLVVLAIVRALVAWRRSQKLGDAPAMSAEDDAPKAHAAPEPAPYVGDAEALLARGVAYARAGKLDLALHTFLGAGLCALDHRGAIRIAKDRTNGEYVRVCGDPSARAPLRELVGEVDRVQFGGEKATVERVSHAERSATALVRAARVAMIAIGCSVMTASLVGCGPHAPGSEPMAGDPAGNELLVELLRRQGVVVAPLAGALASMPLPTDDGARPPVVLVDAERTGLDDDTRAHLARWVEAGGVLVLAGNVSSWPKELEARAALACEDDVVVAWKSDRGDARSTAGGGLPCKVARNAALDWTNKTTPLAWYPHGETYAAVSAEGRGHVLGLATDELLTSAALARPGNAAAFIAILNATGAREIRIARAEDGIAPPANPVSAVTRAGLGLGLLHALAAALVLFVAVGARLMRPKPTPPPRRRAFVEHVEATGALYAKTKMAPYALATYARHVDTRLRARMPRGNADVPAFLAQRTGAALATCEEVWNRARATDPNGKAQGDELDLLKKLGALYAAAIAGE
jgi:hypothetical protein